MAKRKSIQVLLVQDQLKVGDVFTWHRHVTGEIHSVVVTSDGKLDAGELFFTSPTAAAKHFNGNKSVNGWMVWKLSGTKLTLEKLWKSGLKLD